MNNRKILDPDSWNLTPNKKNTELQEKYNDLENKYMDLQKKYNDTHHDLLRSKTPLQIEVIKEKKKSERSLRFSLHKDSNRGINHRELPIYDMENGLIDKSDLVNSAT